MIVSSNRKPSLPQFRELMKNTDSRLNTEAEGKGATYYANKNGTELEKVVCDALRKASIGTPFEDTIELVSGANFPDIVANKYYGVEVKSTNKNHWQSIGSSILESTRHPDIERIFLTFGKLGAPVEFRSRPYEECLRGIFVTHYPRYQIDMELARGETIFDKMGITYDELRSIEDPAEMVAQVSRYYKKSLKKGESLWWAYSKNIEEETTSVMVKLWKTLTPEEKEKLTVKGYTLFPEVLTSGNQEKYDRYALWLVTKQGVINTNIRDSFSAGGKIWMRTSKEKYVQMPAVFGRIDKFHELIKNTLNDIDKETLREYWRTEQIDENRLAQWCGFIAEAVSTNKDVSYNLAWEALCNIFPELENC